MTTPDDGIAAQIRNIEARYGRPLPEWLALIAASGLARHTEVVAMLKADHGMTHGAAHRVSLLARQAAAPAPADPADVLYTGKKAGLQPLHDRLMTVIGALGADVSTAPKKGYLSIRRRNVDQRRPRSHCAGDQARTARQAGTPRLCHDHLNGEAS